MKKRIRLPGVWRSGTSRGRVLSQALFRSGHLWCPNPCDE